MKKDKICVLGHFAFGENLLNGQTIKTKIISDEMEKQLGSNRVMKIDTHCEKWQFLSLVYNIFNNMKKCDSIVMLPAQNGVRLFSPILFLGKKLFNTQIHYIVIGGWLADILCNRPFLLKCLKKFDGIYVETHTMKKQLQKIGFNNISIMPNCKDLYILKAKELTISESFPLQLCTFSRVIGEKGIEDAINSVIKINKEMQYVCYTLDIYGQIDDQYKEKFNSLEKNFPDYIHYCGCVAFNQTTNTLKNYFALLFPTKYYTEGIPGTIIDAYAAGVPVIASKWESFDDLVEEGKTGYGYEFGKSEQLTELLIKIASNPRLINSIKENCIKKAEDYTAYRIVYDFLSGRIKESFE
ncbi:glycosyltransferase [Blautia sp. HCP3S3_H10_1]|uniref:glycosyltransferase n=1 Tax=unclassified Blautia TaxID=2648079 RepID=UPI003F937616